VEGIAAVGASVGDLYLGFLVRGGRGSRSDGSRAITVLIRRPGALRNWILMLACVCGCSCESFKLAELCCKFGLLQAQCSPVVSGLLLYHSKTISTVAEALALSAEHVEY
jgi:hypothetical protein